MVKKVKTLAEQSALQYDAALMKSRCGWVIACLILYTVSSGCAKNGVKISRGEPGDEVQKCLKLSEQKKFQEAIECFEIFKSRFPKTPYSIEAELAIADNYFNKKEFLLAADSYLAFTKMHPISPKTDYAYYRLGLSYLKESPKAIDKDQQYLDDAVYYLRIAATSFPNSPYREAAQASLKDALGRLAKRNYYIGRFYFRTGEYIASIPRFIDVVQNYPEAEIVPKALYKLVVANGKLRRIRDAKLFYSKLAVEYPDNEWTKKAEGKLSAYVRKYSDTDQSVGPAETPEEQDESRRQ